MGYTMEFFNVDTFGTRLKCTVVLKDSKIQCATRDLDNYA